MITFQGTGVALVTPFGADGSVDTDALSRLVTHLVKGQVDYLVVLGTTGEVATLDSAEKQLVIETVFEVNAGRLPIVLGVGGNNTRAVARQLEAYTTRYQPDGILSVSPYYNKPTQAGIFAHYAELVKHTDRPFILYNVPGRTSSHVSPETTLRLAHAFPHIVATKEASGNLSDIMKILREAPEGFEVISGDDLLTFPLMCLGASGVISVLANATPVPFTKMVNSLMEGDLPTARSLHHALTPLMQLIFEEGNPAGVKALLSEQHIGLGQVRLPLMAASPSLRARLKDALQARAQLVSEA